MAFIFILTTISRSITEATKHNITGLFTISNLFYLFFLYEYMMKQRNLYVCIGFTVDLGGLSCFVGCIDLPLHKMLNIPINTSSHEC